MRKLNVFLLTLSLASSTSVFSAVPSFGNMWVFGDSYSDRKNATILAGGVIFGAWLDSNAGYDDGRWSNGPMWVEFLANGLGLSEVTPGFNGVLFGNNLAVGGAKSGTGNSLGQLWDGSGMTAQLLNGFLPFYSNPATNGNDLFVVFGGGNDYFDWILQDASDTSLRDTIAGNAVSNIGGIIRTLYAEGARHFLMPNLPGYSVVDDVNPNPTLFNDYATAFNGMFDTQIVTLRADLPSAIITEVDFFGLFQDVVANPAQFGLSNVSMPCLDLDGAFNQQGLCSMPDDYFMYDYVHPSTVAHAIMGDAALAAIDPVPVPGALIFMLSALPGLYFTRRGRQPRN